MIPVIADCQLPIADFVNAPVRHFHSLQFGK
jgi:hypothetical protein